METGRYGPMTDVFGLTKEGRNYKPDPRHRTVRFALLADCSTQHLATLVKAIGKRAELNIEIYEAPFAGIALEIADSRSGLYDFDPDFVAILNHTEPLKSALLSQGAIAAEDLVAATAGHWDILADRLRARVIQSTFVVPSERSFGNYERMVPDSLGQRVVDINDGLIKAARTRHNVLVNDVDYIAAEVGRSRWRDEKLWLIAKAPCALEFLPLLARNIVDIAAAAIGKVVKCVVLDLDNTLWGGVIGDDGLDGIRLGDLADGEAFVKFQRYLLSLKARGIVLAVCSKNDHHNAILPFERHPDMVLKPSDISVFVANWDDKAKNLRFIQETLNVGFDSMVFVDDNPFERSLVRGLIPDIIVPELPDDPAHYVRCLAELNLFETTTFSGTDRERAELYRVEAERTQAKTRFDNVDDYLRSLDMTVTVERFSPFNLPRIVQLMQRSNQFNLTTRRYSETECVRFLEDQDGYYPFTLSLSDRFGSYGLISIIILGLGADEIFIDEYLMSCRVLQRGVENFAMNHIFGVAREAGARRVLGRYIPTKKNGMVRQFYEQFGFVCIEAKEDGETVWALDVTDYSERAALMTPVFPTETGEMATA